MSLTCLRVCGIIGENCRHVPVHQCNHPCCSDITMGNFIQSFIRSRCVCWRAYASLCLCESGTETGSLFVIQRVKAPIPISMIISYSPRAKTATLIQFISPLLTGAEMLDPAEVTSEVFWGCGVVEFVLRVGRESCSCRVDDFRSHASTVAYLPGRGSLVFSEHLAAPWIYMTLCVKVHQLQKCTCLY